MLGGAHHFHEQLVAHSLEGFIVLVNVSHGFKDAVLEIDLNLLVAVNVSKYLVADSVGGKLIVLRDQADAHMAVFGILAPWFSETEQEA